MKKTRASHPRRVRGCAMMTTAQAAAALGRSVSEVRRLCGIGKLPAQRVGRDWMISEEAVQYQPAKRGRPRMAIVPDSGIVICITHPLDKPKRLAPASKQ